LPSLWCVSITIRDVELRRRIHIGLNKGEARNALARGVFFNRLGELRDRTLENQQHRASGLNLVVAAIVLWNTVYLERAIQALRNQGQIIPKVLLVPLSPLKWEHINWTGDYHWRRDGGLRIGSCDHSGPPLHRPRPFLSLQFFTNRQVSPISWNLARTY
jgi:Tn3 transposase DDE domain